MIYKIIEGYVIQHFDTEKKEFVEQHFIAGDVCEYEDENREPISPDQFHNENGEEDYLPYKMLQPAQVKAITDLLDYGQCQIPNDIWKRLKNAFEEKPQSDT
jgi:hypothetical protein